MSDSEDDKGVSDTAASTSGQASSSDDEQLLARLQYEELQRLSHEEQETLKDGELSHENHKQSKDGSSGDKASSPNTNALDTAISTRRGKTPLEIMTCNISKQEQKQARTSLTKKDLTSSSLHNPNRHEPPVLAAKERHRSVDVDEIASHQKISRNSSETSTLSNFSADGTQMSPLEIVAQQVARSEGKLPPISTLSRSSCGEAKYPSQATKEISALAGGERPVVVGRHSSEGERMVSTTSVDLTSSSLHQHNHQEPSILAGEERNRSVDVDEIASQKRIARNGSEASTLSNFSGDDKHYNHLSPLEIVARQVARSKRKPPPTSTTTQSRPISGECSLCNPSAKHTYLTRDEPGALAGNEQRCSSTIVPSMVGRKSFSGGGRMISDMSVDVDELEQKQQHHRKLPPAAANSNDFNNSTCSSLLLGPGAQDYAHRREEMQQHNSNHKRKSGHMRWSSIATSERQSGASTTTATTATATTATAQPTSLDGSTVRTSHRSREEFEAKRQALASRASSSGMDDSAAPALDNSAVRRSHRSREDFEAKRQALASAAPSSGMDQSAAAHRSHRSRDEFEAKRLSLACTSSQIMVASALQTTPSMTMEVDSTHPMVRSSTKSTLKATRQPQQNLNTHHAPGKAVLENIAPVLPEPTNTASSMTPPNSTYRVTPPCHPPPLATDNRALVEATLIPEDSTTNTDTEKAEGAWGIQEPPRPPPVPPSEEPISLDLDLIVQAHPAKVSDSAQDLLRHRKGQGLLCLLLVVVVGIAGGVTFAVFSGKGNNNNDNATKILDPSDLKASSTSEPPTSVMSTPSSLGNTSQPATSHTTAAPEGILAPSTANLGDVVNWLPNYTLPALKDPESPQSKALDWLINGHEPHHLANLTEARLRQRFALACLYFSSNGIGWRYVRYWLSNLDLNVSECDWFSSYQLPGTDRLESVCDGAGLLVRLALNENILRGTLPKELALLTQLTEISLIADGFFVTEDNKKEKVLSGPLPVEWMVALTNLETLDLSRNGISGPIPTEIGLLTNLRTLRLLENDLDSGLPSQLFQLTDLTEVWLYDNHLQGPLPTQVGLLALADNLRTFAAFKNRFSGALPTELGLLTTLTGLKMHSNRFSGTIPVEISSLTNLQNFEMNDNLFTGTISTEFGRLNRAKGFWLGGNRLNGTLPSELGNLQMLNNVGLSNNQLTGTIPTELGRWSLVSRVVLDENKLTGSAPRELCQIKQANPLFFRLFVDCDEVNCSCWCCWCNCLRANVTFDP